MLAPPAAYDGALVLETAIAADVAEAAAQAARPRPDRSASSAPELGRICVTVTQLHQGRLLQALGVGPTTIVVTGCAEPRQG